ncbi:MAG: hypothetical protein H8K06_12360 [Nitrospira sp.]|uniref:Outer membrane protein beta-barrel domain-containing protein n=1 Tax=Nitrospira defluvii TaxID=330214 RepID=A0ABM8RUT4_9BACT|nr:hypothetical protein [Nitrospira defluvii]MCS6327866.1 hypothetical protein [Nitrospira sp.]CAE6772737.1 conserved exported hypothetical protein [Nitrospira defluvii]
MPSTGVMGKVRRVLARCLATAASVLVLSAVNAVAQEAVLEFPIRPFNVDVMLRQQTFAPDDREIGVQLGITALRYSNVEVRTIYQYFSIHSQEFKTDQHSVFLNPRWNNFIDILDFPTHKPISRLIRHALFGPLEDRAVPYIGALAGGVLPGPGNRAPGHLIGAQVGVRFPVAQSLSVDISVQYSQYGVDFRGEAGQAQQWVFLTGVRF